VNRGSNQSRGATVWAPRNANFQLRRWLLTAPHTPGNHRSSSVVLLEFPKDARKEAGFQLRKVQSGLEPTDWKPFDDVGAGTREIRIRDATGIYRCLTIPSRI
jgi:hypothetical protein